MGPYGEATEIGGRSGVEASSSHHLIQLLKYDSGDN